MGEKEEGSEGRRENVSGSTLSVGQVIAKQIREESLCATAAQLLFLTHPTIKPGKWELKEKLKESQEEPKVHCCPFATLKQQNKVA